MLPWQVECKLSNQDVPEGDLAEFANTPTDFQACPTVGSSVEKTFSLAPYATRQRLLNRPSIELRFAPRPIAKSTFSSQLIPMQTIGNSAVCRNRDKT